MFDYANDDYEPTPDPGSALFPEPKRDYTLLSLDSPEPVWADVVSEYPLPMRWPVGREEVYRLYGASGVLLYIGRSVQTGVRLEHHAATKPWWPLVEKVTIQREFPLGSFEMEEYNAILTEFPVFNIDGVPWRKIKLSGRSVEMDRLRNRVLIANAVKCLDDKAVEGRLAVLRITRPDMFDAYDDDPHVMKFRWAPREWDRTMLIKAEERYFEAFVAAYRGTDWPRWGNGPAAPIDRRRLEWVLKSPRPQLWWGRDWWGTGPAGTVPTYAEPGDFRELHDETYGVDDLIAAVAEQGA